MDYEILASDLLRRLRGRRSQMALSRRLGYRCNVVRSWEARRRFPTAARFLRVAQACGVDVNRALAEFSSSRPGGPAFDGPLTKESVAQFLQRLRGRTPIGEVAERAAASRFCVSRWLSGSSEPRLPDLLRMVAATSLRLLDFVAMFVDPATLPEASQAWNEIETARRAAYELPFSHAVLRAIELREYQNLPVHQPGWIANKIGVSLEEEERSIDLLASTRQIRKEQGRWVIGTPLTIDTRRMGRRLSEWWARVGLERLQAGRKGLFSYNLFTISHADFDRVRELHLAYYRQIRSIVAQSEPADRVAVLNLQLFGLDD